ncbi:MAG: hypothetical protein HDR55_07115 [Treponema sp.]|nr:hypothetical protein [Treponema sp.]MBD5442941.1 hypothetical protein [Treponema sp.]
MPITTQMTEACYEAAKSIYPDRTKISEAIKNVCMSTDMNDRSARDYIKDFFSMREGVKLGRCMAEADARYYFEHIHDDYGEEGLATALDSLQAYLDHDHQNHPGLQELINQFRQIVKETR